MEEKHLLMRCQDVGGQLTRRDRVQLVREERIDHEDIFLHENKGARKRLKFGYVIEEAKLHGQLAVEVWGKLPS